ncbi:MULTISPECIES: helix-turn-helix domain-containing protein [Streptomyces]|uniref:helix-turn-helix domain-containing protein n=1 Tax=Streptomyces TaxID=1883 RepID=UPI000B9E7F3F|nr:helix-turn-helix domain-containing protein [Streptomyces kasugaensis]
MTESSLGQKLGHLIETLHPAGRGPYTYKELETLIRQRAGEGDPTPSHATIQSIRTGKVTNPSVDSLKALAMFFGVPVGYFLDDAVTESVDKRIREIKESADRARAADELADALENQEVRAVAFRLSGLSARSLRGVKSIVEGLREAEGLPPEPPHSRGGERRR